MVPIVGVGCVALALATLWAIRTRLDSARRYAIAESMHELRGALTALELNAVDGAMVELRRDRSRS